MNLRHLCRGTGYHIIHPEWDTEQIVCKRGHIYADKGMLVASIDRANPAESRTLRALASSVVADGDFGELSVAFCPSALPRVARIMKPRQAALLNRAA